MTLFYRLAIILLWLASAHSLQAQNRSKPLANPKAKPKVENLRFEDTPAAPKTDTLFPKNGKPNGRILSEKPPEENLLIWISGPMPEFPGGAEALMRFIRNNLRQPANCTGTVYVSFVIKEDGSVADAQVVKGIGQACDTEALRLFTIMPKWKPGKNDGKEVAFKYSIPVRFQPKD